MRRQVFLILAFLAACSNSTAPRNPFLGTYALVRVNGAPAPPYGFYYSAGAVIVTADSLFLTQGGTTHRIVASHNGAPVAAWFLGVYVQEGDSLRFTATQEDSFRSARFVGDTLLIDAGQPNSWASTMGYLPVR